MKRSSHSKFFGLAAVVLCSVTVTFAGEMTAFQLVKEGNQYVARDSRDQVVQIRSEKSYGSLNPSIWYIVYFDTNASFHATQVKFSGGKEIEVTRPGRLLEYGTSNERTLDRAKLKLDSSKALAIAKKESLLENVKLVASEMKLERSDDGPVWKIKLWAAKLRNQYDDVHVGDVFVLAEDGRVVRSDLHPDRIN